MNYCTKCQSFYAKPGTCNCYATGAAKIVYLQTPFQRDTAGATVVSFDADHADVRNFHLRLGT